MYILLIGQKTKKQQQIPLIKKITKCFQYPVTVSLNHEEIKKNSQRIPKIKYFSNK